MNFSDIYGIMSDFNDKVHLKQPKTIRIVHTYII